MVLIWTPRLGNPALAVKDKFSDDTEFLLLPPDKTKREDEKKGKDLNNWRYSFKK